MSGIINESGRLAEGIHIDITQGEIEVLIDKGKALEARSRHKAALEVFKHVVETALRSDASAPGANKRHMAGGIEDKE